jgi:hypothetical protein
MAITVLHMTETMPRETMLNLTCPGRDRVALAKAALNDGFYEAVAELPFCEDLELAWQWTNNITTSWSMEPAKGVFVVKALPVIKGETYGLRSSMVGDVFLSNGEAFVVDSFGFKSIDKPENNEPDDVE